MQRCPVLTVQQTVVGKFCELNMFHNSLSAPAAAAAACRWMITDIHDAITSLSAHGKELPVGLSQDMKDEIDKLVRDLRLIVQQQV